MRPGYVRVLPAILGMVVVAGLACHVSMASEQNAMPRATCILEASQTQIPAGSPVLVRITVRNSTNTSLWFDRPFEAGFDTVNLDIKRPGSEDWKRLLATGVPERASEHPATPLTTDESFAAYLLLLCDTSHPKDRPRYHTRFVFDTAGRFLLRAVVRYRDGELFSEPVVIEVAPPSEAVRMVMAQLHKQLTAEEEHFDNELRGLRQGLASVSAEGCSPQALELLQTRFALVKEFEPLILLGEAIASLRSRDSSRQQQGLAYLQKLSVSDKPTLWRSLATEHLAVAYARSGQPDKAVQLLREIRHHSQSTRLVNAVLRDRATTQPSASQPLP